MAKKTIKSNNEMELMDISAKVKHMLVTIKGDGDLILNKMNARNVRLLTAEDRKSVSERPNVWEDIITSIHWLHPLECKNTYTDCNEEMMNQLLANNKPCIPSFAFKKSFGDATVRNEIDTYATKINTAVNVVAPGGLDVGGFESLVVPGSFFFAEGEGAIFGVVEGHGDFFVFADDV